MIRLYSSLRKNDTSQIYQTSSRKSANLWTSCRLDDCNLAFSLPEFPRKAFTKVFNKTSPFQKLRLYQVREKTLFQIIKQLKDRKLLQKWFLFRTGKGPVESPMHLCLKLHCANGGELTKCNDNIKLVGIIKSYTNHKDL